MRDAVQELGEVAAEVGVPGVGVHEFAVPEPGGHGEVDGERAQGVVGVVQGGPGAVPGDGGAGVRGGALAPAVHGEIDERRELPGEEFDVDTGPAVNVGRILPAQQSHPHVRPPGLPEPMVTHGGREGKRGTGAAGYAPSGRGELREKPRPPARPGSKGRSASRDGKGEGGGGEKKRVRSPAPVTHPGEDPVGPVLHRQ